MRLPLLILHILGGTLGLIAGTIAMIARKGDRPHRISGNIFTLAMLTLATSGFWLAILKSQVSDVIAAVLTFYLIGSAWLAGRRRDSTGPLDWAGLVLCVASAAGVFALGIQALHSATGTDNGAPAIMSFLFGGILLLAALGISECSRIAVSAVALASFVICGVCPWDSLSQPALSSSASRRSSRPHSGAPSI